MLRPHLVGARNNDAPASAEAATGRRACGTTKTRLVDCAYRMEQVGPTLLDKKPKANRRSIGGCDHQTTCSRVPKAATQPCVPLAYGSLVATTHTAYTSDRAEAIGTNKAQGHGSQTECANMQGHSHTPKGRCLHGAYVHPSNTLSNAQPHAMGSERLSHTTHTKPYLALLA